MTGAANELVDAREAMRHRALDPERLAIVLESGDVAPERAEEIAACEAMRARIPASIQHIGDEARPSDSQRVEPLLEHVDHATIYTWLPVFGGVRRVASGLRLERRERYSRVELTATWTDPEALSRRGRHLVKHVDSDEHLIIVEGMGPKLPHGPDRLSMGRELSRETWLAFAAELVASDALLADLRGYDDRTGAACFCGLHRDRGDR